MNQKITTFFMFNGQAEEAMLFYEKLFENSRITSILRYENDSVGRTGTVMKATFNLNGQEFMCVDSPNELEFSFTPSMSLYVNCESEAEIDHIFAVLSAEGEVYMALGQYGFSKKFGWVSDKFGVSWQLNFE